MVVRNVCTVGGRKARGHRCFLLPHYHATTSFLTHCRLDQLLTQPPIRSCFCCVDHCSQADTLVILPAQLEHQSVAKSWWWKQLNLGKPFLKSLVPWMYSAVSDIHTGIVIRRFTWLVDGPVKIERYDWTEGMTDVCVIKKLLTRE